VKGADTPVSRPPLKGFPHNGPGEVAFFTALDGLPMLRVVVKNPWLMVGVIVALLVLGWVGLEIWFGLTQAR
jgi:hypothetical protein